MLPQSIMALTAAPSMIPNFTTSEAGNPFIAGWYADPDADFFGNQYWVYPTASRPYDEQTYLDAFSSPDLVHWTRHPSILDIANVTWAHRAVWAPCVIHRNEKYYIYFGANDIQEGEDTVGGIGVAVADAPEGPYVDAIGQPLIGAYHHGAQPIDQDVFVDDDGQAYIYYGGHSHAAMAKLNEDMISLGNFTNEDGTTEVFREITPDGYVEGPVMFKRQGKYYLMWSEGGWTGPDYAVAYGTADTPLGPFEKQARILAQDDAVARGSGHNGVVNVPGTDIWYIVYHRRPLSETDANHRVVCYDRLYFDAEGRIQPVRMLVRDNFEDGAMIAWKSYRAEFEVVDGEMVNVVGDGGVVGAVSGMALLDTNFTDLVMEADIRILEEDDGEAMLVFRAENGGKNDFQGYYAGLSVSKKKVRIVKFFAGISHALAEAEMEVEIGKMYRVRASAVGAEIKVFVDDMATAVVTATDVDQEDIPVFLSGQNGVGVFQAKAAFDNVAVDRA